MSHTAAAGTRKHLPAGVRRAIDAGPQPHRADTLRRASPTDPHALWPHLRVVSCWSHGQAGIAATDLQRRLPHVSLQPKGLLATEAFVSIPFGKHHPIAVASHFLEFADEHGEPRLAHELRLGETYSVIVTTGGGLWRYRLGDSVKVEGFLAATPSLRFIGRGGSVSDLCGEKLAEAFVTRAIEAACASCGFAPRFAMLAPEAEATGGWSYTLFVEGHPPPALSERLEDELRQESALRPLPRPPPTRSAALVSHRRRCLPSLSRGRDLPRPPPRRHQAAIAVAESRLETPLFHTLVTAPPAQRGRPSIMEFWTAGLTSPYCGYVSPRDAVPAGSRRDQ